MDFLRKRPFKTFFPKAWSKTWIAVAVLGLVTLDSGSLCQAEELPASDEATSEETKTRLRFVVKPGKVAGHNKCVDCHQAEVAAWQKSKHATIVFDELRTSPNSYQYAKELGIAPENITRNSICITCHATPQRDQEGRMRVIAGVSCEACHNAAGGEEGWLNIHAVYGPTGTPRELETPEHFEKREFECLERGQRRSADVFQLAKSCFQCHIVSDERLANETDHKMGGSKEFEFVSWSLGDVRHNFHLNQQHNAEVSTLWASPLWRSSRKVGTTSERLRLMFLAGLLADLDVSLRHRSRATEEGDFSDALNDRILNARDELEGIIDELEVELPAIQEVVDAVAEIIDEHLDEVEPGDKELYQQAANEVEVAATKFFRTHDGSKLEELDEYGIPTVDDAVGDVYEP